MMANSQEAKTHTILGKQLRCLVCDHDRFTHRVVVMPSPRFAFFDLEWFSPRADVQVCARCGHVHWFKRKKQAA